MSRQYWFNGNRHCTGCYRELALGIIEPSYGPLIGDCEEDLDDDADDDDLMESGELDNAVRAYEDDMPDVSEYGNRDFDVPDHFVGKP